jgi:hypothetical protein
MHSKNSKLMTNNGQSCPGTVVPSQIVKSATLHVGNQDSALKDLHRLNVGSDLDPIFKKLLLSNTSAPGHPHATTTAPASNAYLPPKGILA